MRAKVVSSAFQSLAILTLFAYPLSAQVAKHTDSDLDQLVRVRQRLAPVHAIAGSPCTQAVVERSALSSAATRFRPALRSQSAGAWRGTALGQAVNNRHNRRARKSKVLEDAGRRRTS